MPSRHLPNTDTARYDALFAAYNKAAATAPADHAISATTLTQINSFWPTFQQEFQQRGNALGGVEIALPHIHQVQEKIIAYNAANIDQSAAKDTADQEAEDVEHLRDQADDLIRDIWEKVEFHHRRETACSLRANAREWGVAYLDDQDQAPTQ